jgi:hypothetical protein
MILTNRLIDPSRRDDVESMCYVLIWLLSTRPLPWRSLVRNKRLPLEHMLKEVADAKEHFSASAFCSNLPHIVVQLLDHVRGLAFSDTPDYDLYIDGMMQAFLSE